MTWMHVCPKHGPVLKTLLVVDGEGSFGWYCQEIDLAPGPWRCMRPLHPEYEHEQPDGSVVRMTASEVYAPRPGITFYPAPFQEVAAWAAGKENFDGVTIVEKDFGGLGATESPTL